MAKTHIFLVACLVCVASFINDVQSQRPPRPNRPCQEGAESRLPCTECVCDGSDCTLQTNLTDCFDGATPDIDICQISGDTQLEECLRCQCDENGNCKWEYDPSLPSCDVVDPQFPSKFPPGFGGGSCMAGNVSPIPCIECVCNSTGCTWEFDFVECGIPDLPEPRACESGAVRPSPFCQTCQCDSMGMCSWGRNVSLDGCEVDCEAEDLVQCFVDPCRFSICPANPNATCVSNYCEGCNAVFYDGSGQAVECFDAAKLNCVSGETADDCNRDPCTYTMCSVNRKAVCVPDYCKCEAQFFDESGQEIKCFGSDDDDEDRCQPGARPRLGCRDCVCLNDDCGRCTGKDRCEWYENPQKCRGEEGEIACPGNRPISPCGDVDPCDKIGNCPGNPDLECKKFECSRCQAQFYNKEEGYQQDCPMMDEKLCSVPGRGRMIKLGVTIDDPRDPCQLCVCGTNGDLECTEDRRCGKGEQDDLPKQRRFKVSFSVANCSRILLDPDLREDFIDMFINAISKKANISAAFIKDVVPSCGSIVMEATFVESLSNEGSIDFDVALNLIESGIKDGDLMITVDDEEFDPIPDSFSQDTGGASTVGVNVVVLTILAVLAAIWA